MVIIGAGQAGLSVGYFLLKKTVNFIIIEKNERIGDNWSYRWDSLNLFSPSGYNDLPGIRFPQEAGFFPSKDEVANYLEYYAREFKLPVQTGTNAVSLELKDSTFIIETTRGIYKAKQVVIATGAYQTPYVPSFGARLANEVYQLHSSKYRNPFQLLEGETLVVGTGNSGVQIALDVSRSERKVYLAGRKMPTLPRRFLGKDIYWWYYKLRFATASLDSFVGKWLYNREQEKGEPLLGISLKAARKDKNLVLVPRVESVERNKIILEDGQELIVKNIIWATGFHNDYSWIKLEIFDNQGNPFHKRGVVTKMQGIYFIGLKWLYRMNSSNIGGVGRDAAFVVSKITEYL
ncbi:MAG: flavin-containing monooxygenase [Candidatus Hodarchaeales archaeon]